jgi:hypothetical protein
MILHLCVLDKFIEPFYQLVKENFADFYSNHQFYINGTSEKYSNPVGKNVFLAKNTKLMVRHAWLAKQMNKAEQIMLHGLLDMHVLILLCLQPWLFKKCYWVIWGGDLYTYQLGKRGLRWWRNEFFRRFAIKRLGHFITHIRGDYELAKKWYGAKGVWHECFMYPSNLYHESPVLVMPHEGINILLGNSADPSNNHIDALDKLRPYAADNINIFCPLSYGDAEYAKQVADYGKSIFSDKFNPLLEFMRFDEYKKLLAKIDIAFFNHKRQQAMGNIITLLGLGKKIYLRTETTSWKFFDDLSVYVYDSKNFNTELMTSESQSNNIKIIKNYFSRDELLISLRKIFNYAPT